MLVLEHIQKIIVSLFRTWTIHFHFFKATNWDTVHLTRQRNQEFKLLYFILFFLPTVVDHNFLSYLGSSFIWKLMCYGSLLMIKTSVLQKCRIPCLLTDFHRQTREDLVTGKAECSTLLLHTVVSWSLIYELWQRKRQLLNAKMFAESLYRYVVIVLYRMYHTYISFYRSSKTEQSLPSIYTDDLTIYTSF